MSSRRTNNKIEPDIVVFANALLLRTQEYGDRRTADEGGDPRDQPGAQPCGY